jgi:histidyl-tRNA synthetase
MIGPDEFERGEVLIRDLETGEQHAAPLPPQTENPE